MAPFTPASPSKGRNQLHRTGWQSRILGHLSDAIIVIIIYVYITCVHVHPGGGLTTPGWSYRAGQHKMFDYNQII